ncbi:MAG: TolC family protein [Gemmatimonadaceae bacterium]
MKPVAGILLALVAGVPAPRAGAQGPPVAVTRRAAVGAALSHGARLAVALADTAIAAAQRRIAGARGNPTFAGSWSRATPQFHATVEWPLDIAGVRGLRIRAAESLRHASQYRFAWERAAVAMDADTTYTRALAVLARARLSQQAAADADTLRRIAEARLAVGDAAVMDLELARVAAGQAANAAAADSLAVASALLDVQRVMGMATDAVAITLTDSLAMPPEAGSMGAAGRLLPVAAASAELEAAQRTVALERRSRWGMPSLVGGTEWHDPTGAEPGLLPTVGIALPLPLFDHNQGRIAVARAGEARARAVLELGRVQAYAELSRAQRQQASARTRVARDQALVASAARVARMALVAYREGALALPAVLEARRAARDVLTQYVDDLAAAAIAASALGVLTLTEAAASSP